MEGSNLLANRQRARDDRVRELRERDARTHRHAARSYHAAMLALLLAVPLLVLLTAWWVEGRFPLG